MASLVRTLDASPSPSAQSSVIGSGNLPRENRESKPEKKSNSSIFKGLLLSFLSGVIYSVCAVIVKDMKNIHPGQLAMYRFLAILAFSLPEVVRSRKNIFGPKKLRFLLFLRGIFGASNLFLNFLAFRYLPLGEAAVIIFSVPVFVTIAARIVLKESCGFMQGISVCLTVIGIIFTTGIPRVILHGSHTYTRENIYGIAASLASLLFSTCRFIVLRKVKSVHHSIIMFNFGWVAILETTVLTSLVGNFTFHACGLQKGQIIILGVLSHLGMTLLTMALQCENAGPVSTMRAAADIILAFIWQTFIFHETPDAFGISGAVLVGSSVVLVGLRKWVMSLPQESLTKRRLKFIMI